jgi:CelD/BcsL family acetyltransferase involved in cellulose biosynthesis
MMEILPIDPVRDARWLAYLEGHPEATVFHHPSWIALQARVYGYTNSSLACLEDGRIVGVLPLLEIRSILTGARGVSLPFSDYSAPLADNATVLQRLVSAVLEMQTAHRWKYVEFRGEVEGKDLHPAAAFKRHRLSLSADTEALFRTFDKSQTQRSVNKFQKSGAVVERRTDAGAMSAFMRLNYLTRRKHGLPPQPDRFFEELHRTIIGPGGGFISLARLGSADLGACVFLLFKDTVYYKFGASDEAHLVHRPNHGIMWDAIRWAGGEGCRVLDFGRSDLDGEGLIKFKRGWATEESDLRYFRTSAVATGKTSAGPLEMLKPVFQRLPIPVLKVIGKVLYEHVG